MTMRIGIHLQLLRPGEIGGMEVYVRQLIEHLPRLDPELQLVLFCADYNHHTFADSPQLERRLLSAEAFHRLTASDLEAEGLDLWFCPLLTLEPAEPGVPSVVTIPDLQHLAWSEFFTEEILAWRHEHYPRSVRDANRVLTLSDFSRREIETHLDAPAGKVVAVPLAAAEEFTRSGGASPSPEDGDFWLYPAKAWPHKNHANLFRALARLREDVGDGLPKLVLTGFDDLPEDLARLRGELDLEASVQVLGQVPRAELAALYSRARALVFPSLFEGFGMPVLEAMALGCPVLCSACTSLPEVAGEAAIYFDPEDPASIARELGRLLADPSRADDYRQRGRSRATEFSWSETARETLRVLQDAARERSPLTLEEPPLVSVVIPSFRQGQFIERTLRSVLDQDYPNLEILVMDGGSDDQTVEVLERYKLRYPGVVDFVSEPDRGQAHAVNKGWQRARGEVLGWLNSDDTYEPGCLQRVVDAFDAHPEALWLYGRARYIDVDEALIAPYPTRMDFDWQTLASECFICQPSAFLHRQALDRGFFVDENLQTCMDYDLWIRLGREHAPVVLDAELSNSRMYDENKTVSLRDRVFAEIFGTVKRHYGVLPLSWTIGKAHHWLQDGDPVRPAPAHRWTRSLGFLLHLRHNWDQPAYLRQLGAGAVRRVLGWPLRALRS